MEKYCAKCGARLFENAKFCNTCGAPVEEAEQKKEQSGRTVSEFKSIYNIQASADPSDQSGESTKTVYVKGSRASRSASGSSTVTSKLNFKPIIFIIGIILVLLVAAVFLGMPLIQKSDKGAMNADRVDSKPATSTKLGGKTAEELSEKFILSVLNYDFEEMFECLPDFALDAVAKAASDKLESEVGATRKELIKAFEKLEELELKEIREEYVDDPPYEDYINKRNNTKYSFVSVNRISAAVDEELSEAHADIIEKFGVEEDIAEKVTEYVKVEIIYLAEYDGESETNTMEGHIFKYDGRWYVSPF